MYFYEKITIRMLVLMFFIISIGVGISVGIVEGVSDISVNTEVVSFIFDALILVWFYIAFKKAGNSISQITDGIKKHAEWREIAGIIFFHFIITFGTIFGILLIVSYVNPDLINTVLNDEGIQVKMTVISKVFYGMTAVFLAPIVEEFAFRGIILNRLKLKFGLGPAVIISSILFGILHYKFAIVGAATFGVCISLVYLRTRSIGVCILIHFINNLISSVFSFVSSQGTDTTEVMTLSDARTIGWVLGVPLIVGFLVYFVYFIKKNWKKAKANGFSNIGNTIALIVLDMQNGLFNIPGRTLYNDEQLITRVKLLIDKARETGVKVIYTQHDTGLNTFLQKGTENWGIHSEIKPMFGDSVIHKNKPNPFYGTNLKQELENIYAGNLVVVGVQTEYSVDTTCRQAVALGYNVTLVADAHSTFDSELLNAQSIIEHHNHVLNNGFVTLKNSEEILGSGY